MSVVANTPTAALLSIGERWLIEVLTYDDDGILVSGAPTVVVTLPNGTTTAPSFTEVTTGYYRAAHTVAASGRHVAEVTATGYGAEQFAVYAAGVTTGAGMPLVNDVADYLRENAASWATADLQDALDAEAAAQRSMCRVGAVFPADLRQALLRRVQRNLALRQLPLAVLQGDAELGSSRVLPGRDPEVRRLEAPHRKLAVG